MAKIFVCFTGSDGSGKSTMGMIMFNSLAQKNKKTRKIYGRYRPILTKYMISFARKFLLPRNEDMFSDYPGFLNARRSIFEGSSIISRLYLIAVIVEYFFQITIKLTIPYKLGSSIISDRYVYDTLINDVSLYTGLSVTKINELLQRLWYFIPKPDIVFLLQVPEQVALQRKNDIPSLDYLMIRNKLYCEIAGSQQFVILDGTINPSILKMTVLEEIDRLSKN
jgi:thymidylate kinase